MIDDPTRQALETHLAVQLAIMPRARFRDLARPHGGDDARAALAAQLTASLAFAFDITPSGARGEALKIPAPTDGRKSWADPKPE